MLLLYISWVGISWLFYKKNSILCAVMFFVGDTRCKIGRSIFDVLYPFVIEKVRILFRREKNYARRYRSNNTPVLKIVFKISFRQFRSNSSWARRNKVTDRNKPTREIALRGSNSEITFRIYKLAYRLSIILLINEIEERKITIDCDDGGKRGEEEKIESDDLVF